MAVKPSMLDYHLRTPLHHLEEYPDNISNDEQVLFLSDILPTGYFGADIANVYEPGDDVAVFGAGPVGYFAVMSSFLRGAARVFLYQNHLDERLAKTKDLGAEIINFDDNDPVEKLKKESKGNGVLCIDAVGFEAVGHTSCQNKDNGNSDSNNKNNDSGSNNSNGIHDHSKVTNPIYEPANPIQVLEWMCQSARKYSTLSIPGVYGSAYDKFPFWTNVE